jgi:hypothetical protein
VPLPIPANQQQVALVSKVAIAENEVSPLSETPGTSEAERMLKPYGINMLPKKQYTQPEQQTQWLDLE